MFQLPEIIKLTPTNHVREIMQQPHFINTSTNPEGCHMSNFIHQNEVNMANELLKVQQPLLESSSEMDKLRCYNQYGAFSSHQNYCDGDKFSFSRVLSDRGYQLTKPWSAKIVDEVVKEVQRCGVLVP